MNLNEDYEVRYWNEKFGCTNELLKTAVAKAGVSSKAVEVKSKNFNAL